MQKDPIPLADGESSDTATETPPSIPSSGPATLAESLESWSTQILEDHCNAKKFNTESTGFMAPSFRAKHDGLPTARSRQQHLDNLKRHFSVMPEFHLELLNCSSEVDEQQGLGMVYMFFRLSKLVGDLQRESIAVLKWERRHGEWLCVKHTGLRGPSGFPDT